MIAIARKNLLCLFLNPNSFPCNSNVHLSLSIHFFSTLRSKRLIPNHEIYDVLLHKHQFSLEFASLASSRSPKFGSPKRADSILSFLKENSFTTTQLEKIVVYNPRILGFTIENIKFKFKVFQELGFSSEEIAKIMTSNQTILHSSMANKIIPSLSTLKGLLRSIHDVARLVKKSGWVVVADLEKTLIPNVEILKSYGIPMERILHFLYVYPRCFLIKPDIMRKSVDKVIAIRVSRTSITFMKAVEIIAFTSEGMWEVKLQAFRDLGFSDMDISTIFRKSPSAFTVSMEKMKMKIELLLATGKYNISNIVTSPSSLGCSIERRLEPRLQILGVLESRNLIEKWPPLGTISAFTDERFVDRFVRPYCDEIGKEYITKIL